MDSGLLASLGPGMTTQRIILAAHLLRPSFADHHDAKILFFS